MRAVVVGAGAVGARVARQLIATEGLEDLVVDDRDQGRARSLVASLGDPARTGVACAEALEDADVVVLSTPSGHRALAERALEHGVHVISTADSLAEVRALLDLDAEARERDLTIATGVGFAPGLSCLLARHAAAVFDTVDEVHVAASGAGGPACARSRAGALRTPGLAWENGTWIRHRAGSGRQLVWFPDPVGAREAVHAGTAAARLLAPALPHARRVTARLVAGHADRVLSALPRRGEAEGMVGALRVEVRGRRNGTTDVTVLGALDRPAVAAGAVAAVVAAAVADGRVTRAGAAGVAELVQDPVPFLAELARRGVRAAVYEGTPS